MLYFLVCQSLHSELCVLKISTDVLDLTDVVVADQNAATGRARFYRSPAGLEHVDRDMVFAEYWTNHADPAARLNHKAIKCAEVLVPRRVGPGYIVGAYVSCIVSRDQMVQMCGRLPVAIDSHMFFR